ncbi:TetR/AcrR family transcriptional regulator [Streptomyces sp. AM8-1-1]|uniref:TetR/AcrR family transcriptional regulator n=1 Tax=Streptomyces sp. AM8-1-1 TaxID=3075825 RepID=UPI0028C41D31|nr:TetR family transcriptional regulator [Streptomyces sp. AM8-1-1]WNO72636.1 TetR family transcriptional regulator [Streptomyces sp. AM8-1-1]
MAATTRSPSGDPPVAAPPRPGLRERKKLRTRTAIRRATFRLIAAHGYEATTVEQIAEAADVSPSTVFRYFATKEDIVLADEYDRAVETLLRARPAAEPPLESLRAALTEAFAAMLAEEPEEMRQRSRLIVEVPALRARMTGTMAETALLLARAIAGRAGREPDDLDVRVFTAAVMGALREALIHWAERGQQDDLVALVHRTLDTLQGGLRLR